MDAIYLSLMALLYIATHAFVVGLERLDAAP